MQKKKSNKTGWVCIWAGPSIFAQICVNNQLLDKIKVARERKVQ